jgi:tetratricopeptide (TPR) repeat protein
MNTSRPPPFWELEAMPFQEICRDVLREDPAVSDCHIYGKNGQGQFGIDLEASLHTDGCWTAQCKAYEELTWTELRDAADEFWKHRARWKERGAKRFIVLVGCGVVNTKVWDQVQQQKEKFKYEGLEFDLWDSRELVSRLKSHRSIVERHCKVGWAEVICGTASTGVTLAESGSAGRIFALALPLVDEISSLRDQRLAEIRELIRAGKELSAERELEEMCSALSWQALAPKVRVRALRLRIGLALGRRRDVQSARELLTEARAIAPDASLKVPEALIAYHLDGADAALKILEPSNDLDEWNLQLTLLLNLGRAPDVLKALDAPRFSPDAETWRLRAVAMVVTRSISGARLAIKKALEMSPTWRRLEEAAAVIDYYSALSPAVDSLLNFEWPTPPDWQFVRRDDESIAALRRAAESFAKLATAPEITQTERKGLEVWHLAALANDPARENEAVTFARGILGQDPGHTRVAIWASHRGYEFDRATVRAALERDCIGKPVTIEPVQALFALLVKENDIVAAGNLLDAHRSLYERRHAMGIWRFQRAQAWMAVDEKEKARALLVDENDESERCKMEAVLVRVEASRGGSRAAVATVFAERFKATKADADLFSACEAHLYCDLPEYVATNAKALVRRIGTESALRLALDGSFAAGQYDLCLELLARHVDLFPGRSPPPVVQRLRVQCLRSAGRLLEAQRAAETLAQQAGESMDLFAVFETQRSAGDMAAAAVTGRQLLSRPDITPEGLLHLSMHLGIDAPDVAKEAFERVLKRGVETAEQAAVATQVGFDLGFDDQLGPIIGQAIAASAQPGAPFVRFSLAEALEMMTENRGAREEHAAAYGRGEVPVHLYAQADRIPLTTLYRGILLQNEDVALPFGAFATLIRHGSRNEPRSIATDKMTGLFLDVTSYLLAGHLDLLDALEAEFAPLKVSPHLPSSLQEQLGMLAKEQIARQPPKAEVLDLVAEQRIALVEIDDEQAHEKSSLHGQMGTRWCGLLAQAQKNGGYLIDFLPLRSNDTAMHAVDVPPEVADRLRSTGDLVQALKRSGALKAEQYDLALNRLGGDGAISGADTRLEPDSFVILEWSGAENLAHAGVLRALANRCRVAIDIAEHRQLVAETAARRKRMELVAWLRHLRDRLRRGLEDGTYETSANLEVRRQEANFTDTSEGRCAWDLLDQKRPETVWTCCDDRFIGRFKDVGQSHLIDIFDLLYELRSRGRLSSDALFSHLARLRAGNARYLPISADEILHQLGRAEFGATGLIETPELACLRRYAAACVLDTERLQRPPPDHPKAQELTEINCIMTFYSAGSEALIQLWRDDSLPRERLLAASDWLLHQFLFDVAGAVEVWNQGTSSPAIANMMGLSDANLLFRAIALPGKNRLAGKPEASTQELFFRWLLSRLEPDAPRLAHIGRHLRKALLEFMRLGGSKEERFVAVFSCGEFYVALPQELRRAVRFRKSDLAALKLDQWQPLELGKHSFDARDFWRAAERTHRRGEAALTARVPARIKFNMRAEHWGERPTVLLESTEAEARMRVSDTALSLVQSDPEKREAGLRAERRWLDVSTADAKSVFPRIAGLKSLHERLRQYYELRENSLSLHFNSLSEFFVRRDVHPGDVKPPSIETILKHIRVLEPPSNGESRISFESAAKTLLADEGFEETFARIAAFPVALPAVLVTAFADLDPSRREKWVGQALDEIKTPIMQLHLAHLLLDGNDQEIESAVSLLSGFASDEGSDYFDAFEAIFSWTYREIISSSELNLPDVALLTAVWSYSARLHQLLSAYVKQADIVGSLKEGGKPRPRELLRSRQNVWLDVAGPQLVSKVTLAVHGMASLLEGRMLAPELHERIAAALKKLCFPFSEIPTLPALPLLRIRVTQRDVLGSFLAECRTGTLGQYLGEEEAKRFSDAQIQADIEQVITRIEEQGNDKDAWTSAIPFLGMHPPPAERREDFRRCLLATDWTHFAEVDEKAREGILLFLTSQAGNFTDDEIHDHFRAQLQALARRFAATLMEPSAIKSAALLLANSAHFLGISRGDEITAANALVSIVGEICGAWPKAVKYVWRLNTPLLLRQPAVQLQKLWPLIFRLRATSERLEP